MVQGLTGFSNNSENGSYLAAPTAAAGQEPSLGALKSASLSGHSIVTRRLRLRTWTRIGRSEDPVRFGAPIAIGRNAGPLGGTIATAVFPAASFTHRRNKLALICRSSATPATEAPASRQAATASALKAGECRRRRFFSLDCTSVHLFF